MFVFSLPLSLYLVLLHKFYSFVVDHDDNDVDDDYGGGNRRLLDRKQSAVNYNPFSCLNWLDSWTKSNILISNFYLWCWLLLIYVI
jgi:hypothetical protein